MTARFVSNCTDCEDLIEVDDPAGYVHGRDGIRCVECIDYYDSVVVEGEM